MPNDTGVTLSHVAIYVRDYDEALRYYTGILGFEKRLDVPLPHGERWVTVGSKGEEVEIVLQRATGDRASRIGQGPTWVLGTRNCRASYEILSARGVKFSEPPTAQPWGVQAVFSDLYGNTFALVESS